MATFRFHAKKVGLTYSCPTDATDNPIPGMTELRDAMELGPSKYVIAEELHESGKRHYHCYFYCDTKINTTVATFFDRFGVHPNIINKPGNGWIAYCKKDKKYITNIEEGSFKTALDMESADKAIDFLWQHEPRLMCTQGHNIERNVRQRLSPPYEGVIYPGPYPKHYYPTDWDYKKHSLLLWGPPETSKTQFARYLLKHTVQGPIQFFKKNPELLKQSKLPFVFDEINMLNRSHDDSREITDVETGGSISARNVDAQIPPVPRIFISNFEFPFKNPADSVYGRRVVTHAIPAFSDKT